MITLDTPSKSTMLTVRATITSTREKPLCFLVTLPDSLVLALIIDTARSVKSGKANGSGHYATLCVVAIEILPAGIGGRAGL
ncbi:hypothetical protein D3C76_1510150 [compost metagenome]